MPIYNAETTLEACVRSIQAQTYDNIEIILVNDGSTDSSKQICEALARGDSRIIVVNKENEGLPLARKTGLEYSMGEFIGFVDADDWIEKNMYNDMILAIDTYHADIANCKFIKEFPDGTTENSSALQEVTVLSSAKAIEWLNLEIGLEASLANKLIKKELFAHVPFKAGVTIGEDYRSTYYLLEHASNIVCIPHAYYHYVQHGDSICYKGYSGNGTIILESYTEIKEKIRQNFPELYLAAVRYWIIQEMAVIISMIKSNYYDKDIIQKIKYDVRKNIKQFIKCKNTALYLKVCALLLCINEIFLIYPYKAIFLKIFNLKLVRKSK